MRERPLFKPPYLSQSEPPPAGPIMTADSTPRVPAGDGSLHLLVGASDDASAKCPKCGADLEDNSDGSLEASWADVCCPLCDWSGTDGVERIAPTASSQRPTPAKEGHE